MRTSNFVVAAALLVAECVPPAAAQIVVSSSPDSAAPAPAPAPVAPVAAPAPATAAVPAPADAVHRVALRPQALALAGSINTEPTDFDFKDSDIGGILRAFAAKFDKNIVAGPGVVGKVTLRLRGVPFDEAFRVLLDQLGFVAIQKTPSVIEVIKASELSYLVESFPLRYRFAQEVKPTLESMLRPTERVNTLVSVDIPSNALIVTSTSEILQKMKATVEHLDVPSPQIAVKARLIEIQADNLLNWGVTWSQSSAINADTTVRSVNTMSNYTQDAGGTVNTSQTLTKFPTGLVIDAMTVLDKTKLYGVLNMIKTDTNAKTISEPSILTGNNKTAKIHVGQNLPVVTSQVTQTATTQSIQYIPEGVDLDVTPIVSPGSDMISFQIRIGVSELVGFQNNNPITTERVAQTAVTVESGKTVVIGGLIKDKTTDVDSGVPILKDIPLLGWFFKTKNKQKTRTELLIFITPELAQTQPI